VVLGELLNLEFIDNKPVIHCKTNGTKPFDPKNDYKVLINLCNIHKITVSDEGGFFCGYSQEKIKGEEGIISRSKASTAVDASISALIALLQTNNCLMHEV
tara:strand:+ start:769 stop:1071 length:303 start_codon:yes stop_codon:yes gene_type:complete